MVRLTEQQAYLMLPANTWGRVGQQVRVPAHTFDSEKQRMVSIRNQDYILLQFHVTNRCNYRCPYCYSRYYDTSADMFAKRTPREWMDALPTNLPLKRLQFSLSGGEPLIYKPFMEFLRLLVECDRVEYIRVDSNGSTVDRLAGELSSPKIRLMCTFHPSRVTLDRFLERVDVTQQAGMLDMVNSVALPQGCNKSEVDRLVRAFAERGIFMNVAYDFFQPGEYRLADMRHLLSLRTRRAS